MYAWCAKVTRPISWSWPNANIAVLPSRSCAASFGLWGNLWGELPLGS
jgi:hypothetical protein